jgi:hypothetical protein
MPEWAAASTHSRAHQCAQVRLAVAQIGIGQFRPSLVAQRAVNLTASRLRRALWRIECVRYALSCVIQTLAGFLGGALGLTSSQAKQHHAT